MKKALIFLLLTGLLGYASYSWWKKEQKKYALPETAEFFRYGEVDCFVWDFRARREVPLLCEVYYALDSQETALGFDGAGLTGFKPGQDPLRMKFSKQDQPFFEKALGDAQVFVAETANKGTDMELAAVPARLVYQWKDRGTGAVGRVVNEPRNVQVGGTIAPDGRSYMRLWFRKAVSGQQGEASSETVTYRFPPESVIALRALVDEQGIRAIRHQVFRMKNPG